MMYSLNNTFGFEPSNKHYDVPPNYNPDINITELCNDTNNYQYLKCICEMKWTVALGHINILYATVVLY